MSLSKIISCLAAENGLTIWLITKSTFVHEIIFQRGYKMPKNENEFAKIILRYVEERKKKNHFDF